MNKSDYVVTPSDEELDELKKKVLEVMEEELGGSEDFNIVRENNRYKIFFKDETLPAASWPVDEILTIEDDDGSKINLLDDGVIVEESEADKYAKKVIYELLIDSLTEDEDEDEDEEQEEQEEGEEGEDEEGEEIEDGDEDEEIEVEDVEKEESIIDKIKNLFKGL